MRKAYKLIENNLNINKKTDNIDLIKNKDFLKETNNILENTRNDLNIFKKEVWLRNYFLNMNCSEKYKENKDFIPVIDYCLTKLFSYEQVSLVLDARWKKISKRPDSEKMLKVIKILKDKWFLDFAWIIFEENLLKNDKKSNNNIGNIKNYLFWNEKR